MTILNYFVPNRQNISSISQSNPAVVTTTQDNGYHDGLFVRLNYPLSFGMNQLIGQVFQITILSSTTFSIDVDTRNFDAFTIANTLQTAQVIPVGEIATTLVNAVINNNTDIPET